MVCRKIEIEMYSSSDEDYEETLLLLAVCINGAGGIGGRRNTSGYGQFLPIAGNVVPFLPLSKRYASPTLSCTSGTYLRMSKERYDDILHKGMSNNMYIIIYDLIKHRLLRFLLIGWTFTLQNVFLPQLTSDYCI